jgi:hypothetical protein
MLRLSAERLGSPRSIDRGNEVAASRGLKQEKSVLSSPCKILVRLVSPKLLDKRC